MPITMKAERIPSFGGPEVLKLEDVPKPRPNSDEMLVRLHAAGVNPVDCQIRGGLLGAMTLPAILGLGLFGRHRGAALWIK